MTAVSLPEALLEHQLKSYFASSASMSALKASFNESSEKPFVTLLFPSLYPVEGQALVDAVLEGLENHEPEMVEDGEGGTYFLRDVNGNNIAVFKPADEEPFSVGNPKRGDKPESDQELRGSDIKKGILPGEGCYREVAAYLLDKDFAKVPLTVFVEFNYPLFNWKEKQGSLQKFVPHHFESWDIGPTKYRVSDVHRIGILDLRIFNVDRHGGNLLVKRLDIVDKGCYDLIPIDHGLSLPESVNGTDLWFEWLTWSQAKAPFGQEELQYIANINVAKDAALLRELGIREECVRTMMISTTLLKLAAAKGMTLFQIAHLLCRPKSYKKKGSTVPSPVEVMAENLPSTKSKYFLVWLETEISKLLEQQLPSPKENNKKPPTTRHLRRQRTCMSPAPSINAPTLSVPQTRRVGPSISAGVSLPTSASAVDLFPSTPIAEAPRTHMRSNSSILEIPDSFFSFMRRNWSHEGLATLG
eukprot:TRINITY_DN1627_c0_g1_i1.p1 TRINITY_DN1627_c0_g1~~TRINITY_DN1627_c0_g1_i1.p1  ORF type:complete len:472 (-),score=83.34 TRINITY_DN1627_c0_g1_i1:194-1609(-)